MRAKTRRNLRYSPWVETTFLREGREILLPIRARVRMRGQKAQSEAWILVDGTWQSYRRFPSTDVGFDPTEDQLDGLAEAVADAIVEWLEEHDPEGLETLLENAPLVSDLPEVV